MTLWRGPILTPNLLLRERWLSFWPHKRSNLKDEPSQMAVPVLPRHPIRQLPRMPHGSCSARCAARTGLQELRGIWSCTWFVPTSVSQFQRSPASACILCHGEFAHSRGVEVFALLIPRHADVAAGTRPCVALSRATLSPHQRELLKHPCLPRTPILRPSHLCPRPFRRTSMLPSFQTRSSRASGSCPSTRF